MAGSERRSYAIVVIMGRQPAVLEQNALSCSSGANRLGRNRRWKQGMSYRRTEEKALCSIGHGRNGILFTGRGLVYPKTEETDLLWWKRGPVDREGCGIPQNGGNRLVLECYGRNGGPIHWVGCGVPQNGRNKLVLERYGRNRVPVHREGCDVHRTPRDIVHRHRRLPPRATVHPPSTSSGLHL